MKIDCLKKNVYIYNNSDTIDGKELSMMSSSQNESLRNEVA